MTDDSPSDVAALTEKVQKAHAQLSEQISRVIVGQTEVVDQMLIALFCQGHAVLVGVPGLAKTLLVSTIARSLSLDFSRIQFTPDLMPSDITGTEVIEEDRSTGRRELRFVRGPVFANVLLADEINRTPPKTQAALLEAMQEHQVTAGGERHHLPEPFFVLATQNPIEQEGTYPLPEAQLDRFMFMINVPYPSEDEELQIVRRTTGRVDDAVEPVLDAQQVLDVQRFVRDVPVADHVIRYALRLVRATRLEGKGTLDFIDPTHLCWNARVTVIAIRREQFRVELCVTPPNLFFYVYYIRLTRPQRPHSKCSSQSRLHCAFPHSGANHPLRSRGPRRDGLCPDRNGENGCLRSPDSRASP